MLLNETCFCSCNFPEIQKTYYEKNSVLIHSEVVFKLYLLVHKQSALISKKILTPTIFLQLFVAFSENLIIDYNYLVAEL